MASFTRSRGTNAYAQNWDELLEDEQPQGTGSWLPLNALDEEAFVSGPALHSVPQTRRGPAPVSTPVRDTARHPGRATQVKEAARKWPMLQAMQGKWTAVLAGGAICALALYAVVSAAIDWTQVKLDDMQYGRPRTSQYDAYVGHNEASGVPTHFVAMNLNRRVTILELPGGDSAKATAIIGPYLFGQGEDLTPVQVATQDLNADSKPDLVVTVKNEQLIYLNDGSAFRLITPEERAALQKSLSAAPSSEATPAPEGGK